MRGYPGSRGTGGKLGINPNKPPSDQTTFETTEPLRDENLPLDGLRLTALPLIEDEEVLLPRLTAPALDVNELRGNLNPAEKPPPLEVTIKEGRIKTCKFYITDILGANHLCLRTTNYNEGLMELEKSMTEWYTNHTVGGTLRMMDIIQRGYYAAECLIPNEGKFAWARVCVTEYIPVNATPRPIKVAAIDYGFNAEVPLHKLAMLRKKFREELPQVGLKGELKKKFSTCNPEVFDGKLKEHLVKKTVQLYDGSYEDDGVFAKINGVFFMENGDTVQDYVEKLV